MTKQTTEQPGDNGKGPIKRQTTVGNSGKRLIRGQAKIDMGGNDYSGDRIHETYKKDHSEDRISVK